MLTDFPQLRQELEREAFRFVVPDFRLNKAFDQLLTLPQPLKGKVEFLCNECCWFGCKDRKACYEAVSRKNLGEHAPAPLYCAGFSEWLPFFPGNGKPRLSQRPRYSNSLSSPGFFATSSWKAAVLAARMILEFLLYYLTKPDYQLRVREEIYLDAMLDLF